MALVEQLVPNTVANLLVRLTERRKRGEGEKHIKIISQSPILYYVLFTVVQLSILYQPI